VRILVDYEQPPYRGQPQRYCRNCGAELRTGTAFCTSCGASLGPTPIASGPQASRTDSQTQAGSPSGAWLHGPGVDGLCRLPGRAVRWLRDLPVVPKLALLGVGLLALLVFLSPVTYVLAALACVVSLAVLAVRAFQRRPVRRWGIAVATSLVLAFSLSAIAGALYGDGSTAGTDSEQGSGSMVAGEDQYSGVTDPSFEDTDAGSSCNREDVAEGTIDYDVVHTQPYEDPSGVNGIYVVVASAATETFSDLVGAVQAEYANYDAIEFMFYAREYVTYDPSTDTFTTLPGVTVSMDTAVQYWPISNSPDGESVLGPKGGSIYSCGSSYESGGYKYAWR
jgi:hypothetical protein